MAKRTFTANLSVKSIENLKKELLHYRDVELPNKCREFVTRLAELGIPIIERKMNLADITYDEKGIESGSDTKHYTYIDVKSFGSTSVATLHLEGKDVLFIEFGAGTFYNGAVGQSKHPQGEQFGYLIGTYGMGNGAKKVWGYYDDNGQLVLTKGTKATMPMHSADVEIINNFKRIAREVFG